MGYDFEEGLKNREIRNGQLENDREDSKDKLG